MALCLGALVFAIGWSGSRAGAYEAPLGPVKPYQPIDLSALKFPDRHPVVFYSPAEVAQIKQILATGDESIPHVRVYRGVEENANRWVGLDVTIDPKGGAYGNIAGNLCATDGTVLRHKRMPDGVWIPFPSPGMPEVEKEQRLPDGAWLHVCPKCSVVYQGEPYDSYARGAENMHFARRTQDLGIAYLFTGDERYAQRVRQILLGFAETYAGMTTPVMYEDLQMNYWTEYLVLGYDSVYESPAFSAQDRALIEGKLFRPLAADRMRGAERHGRNNRGAYTIAEAASIGFLLRDREMVEACINGPRAGFAFLMANCVDQDGLWSERLNYHWYTLTGLFCVAEPAYRAGLNLYQYPPFHAMLAGPVQLQFPDGGVDDRSSRLPRLRYEIGQLRAPDPLLASVVAGIDLRNVELNSRTLWIIPNWSTDAGQPPMNLQSKNFYGWGYAILRGGQAPEQSFLSMAWADHAIYGGHVEALKFAVIYHAGGRLWTPFAMAEYTNELSGGWSRKAVAHNALTVDGEAQTLSFGRTTAFQGGPRLQLAEAEERQAYPGVTQKRMIMLADGYAIDVCRAASDIERRYDLAHRYFGDMTSAESLQSWKGSVGWQSGLEYINDVRYTRKGSKWSADWRQDAEHALRLTMLGASGAIDTEIIAGKAPGGGSPGDPADIVLARRWAKRTAFVSLLEAYGDQPTIKTVEPLSTRRDEWSGAKITRAGATDYLLVNVGTDVSQYQDFRLEGEFGLISMATGSAEARYAQLVNARQLVGGGWTVTSDQPATLYVERADGGAYLISADSMTSGTITLQARSVQGATVKMVGAAATVNAMATADSVRFEVEAGQTYRVSGLTGLAAVALQMPAKPTPSATPAAPSVAAPPNGVLMGTIEGKNRVRNSGFEFNGAEHAKVDPWQYRSSYYFQKFTPKYNYDRTVAHSGQCSLHFPRVRWFDPVSNDGWLLQKDIVVWPGPSAWTLSAYVRADKPTKVRLCLYGNEVGWGENDEGGVSPIFNIDTAWQRVSITRQFQPGISSLGIVIKREHQAFGGDVWIDDVQLEHGDTATDYAPDPWWPGVQ
jgi:hypothetical protein